MTDRMDRFMRVVVFFDLPTVSNFNLKEYRRFRKFLLNEGFIMMQESVYVKLVLNPTAAGLVKSKIRQAAPADGLIEMLVITEKQFAGIEYVSGSRSEQYIEDDKRLVVI